MADTRRAICQGRVLATEGLFELAKETWKNALRSAYSLKDYAAVFVLSVNIGEACLRMAMQSKDVTAKTIAHVQEAKENFDYALSLVEVCSFREILGEYTALYQGVRRVETLKRKTEKLQEKLQLVGVAQNITKEKKLMKVCTTCGKSGKDVILDENDGCFYCVKCYEEYYASVELDARDAKKSVAAVNNLKVKKENDIIVDLCLDAGPGDANSRDTESSSRVEPAEIPHVENQDKHAEATDTETIKIAAQDRTRYERVELGSLADYLAGSLKMETRGEKPECLHNRDSNGGGAPLLLESTSLVNDELSEECSKRLNDNVSDVHKVIGLAASDEIMVRQNVPLLDENLANGAHEKRKYSIVQLLEIQKVSPCECPESLLTSPVWNDESALTPARNKFNNSRKMSSSKRLTTSLQEPSADVFDLL